jgi:hypothetical protein
VPGQKSGPTENTSCLQLSYCRDIPLSYPNLQFITLSDYPTPLVIVAVCGPVVLTFGKETECHLFDVDFGIRIGHIERLRGISGFDFENVDDEREATKVRATDRQSQLVNHLIPISLDFSRGEREDGEAEERTVYI